MRCLDCSNVMSEPQPTFICLDCRAVTAGDAVNSADWHHYGVTDRGAMLLHARAPSDVNLEALSQALMRADPVKDFVMLVREQILVANRYQRPIVLARVGIVRRPSEGPQHFFSRAARALPAQRHELEALMNVYLSLRYTQDEPSPESVRLFSAAVREFRPLGVVK